MKKTWITLGLALCVGMMFSTAASAGGVGVFGTFWDTDDADSDTGFGLRVVIDLGKGGWNIDARTSFFEGLTTQSGVIRDDLESNPIDLSLTYDLSRFWEEEDSPLEVYAGGGLSYSTIGTKLGEADDELGINLLVGLQYTYTKHFAVFGDLGLRNIDAQIDGSGFDFDQRPLSLSGPQVNVGLMLGW